jgi:hypothetical protein
MWRPAGFYVVDLTRQHCGGDFGVFDGEHASKTAALIRVR